MENFLEHKISWKVLKIFPQKCSNDDLGLTLTFLMAMSNLLPGLAFIREEFMELVEDLGAEVNKYSQRNEYMNIVLFR